MTDNTQKLDEILKEVREASWSMGLQGAPLDQLHNPRNNKRATNKAKQAIIDWHNKQLEEVLDKIMWAYKNPLEGTGYVSIEHVIEFERNKLTMANSPQLDKLKENTDE